MRYATLLAVLLMVNPATAQNVRPSLTWQGEITGGATIFIQGKRVDVQGRGTGSVFRHTYHFRDPLPALSQKVELKIAKGSGRVEITEQPTRDNDYSAIVDIRNDGKPEQYALEFFWKSGKPPSPRPAARREKKIRWSGRVDGNVRINVRGNRITAERVSGEPITNQKFHFGAPLPRESAKDIALRKLAGRGEVKIVHLPDSTNSYTLMLEINDKDTGQDFYDIEIAWL